MTAYALLAVAGLLTYWGIGRGLRWPARLVLAVFVYAAIIGVAEWGVRLEERAPRWAHGRHPLAGQDFGGNTDWGAQDQRSLFDILFAGLP